MNEQGYVSANTSHGVCRIEFFHPQSNSMPSALLAKLAEAITNAGNDDLAKVIVLSSAGEKVFCAGASFDELATIQNENQGMEFFSGFANLINAMRKCPKFIVGRIHGKCAGGGAGIAAACDYAVATSHASVKLSELAIGLGPFVVGPPIERKIGLSAFSQLAIDATHWRSAQWAYEKGLFASIHEDAAGMDAAIDGLLAQTAQASPQTMAAIKKVLWQGTEHWDELLRERAAISGQLVLSDFTRNAIASFKAGR